MTPAERAHKVVTSDPEDLEAMIAQEISDALVVMLRQVGTPGTCRGPNCGAPIIWVRSSNNNGLTPFDARMGINHYLACPDAKLFRRGHKKKPQA